MVYLQVGQPSTGAPAAALEAVQRASHESTLGYTGAAGLKPLRERIARDYAESYGVDVDPGRVVITFGASGAMLLALIGGFERGARVGLPQPFYYAYRYAMPTVSVECVPFYPSMETHFQPTVADLEAIDGGIDGLIFASPGNPTGSMMPPGQFADVADYCKKKQIRLISDEIYHNVVYDHDVPQSTAFRAIQFILFERGG